MPGSKKYTYYVSPSLLYKSLGKELPSKYKEKEETENKVKTSNVNEFGVITNPVMSQEIINSWRNKNAF